jgi:hypothetical protein
MSLVPLRRTLLITLAALTLIPGAAHSRPVRDLRSPDTRDAAARLQAAQDLRSLDTRDAAARLQAAQDLRSPDTRDAATRHQRGQEQRSLPGPTSDDERSALAQEGYYQSYNHSEPRSPQPAGVVASSDGIAPPLFVLAVAVALMVGLVAGSGLQTVRTRRRHAAGLAT